MKISTKIIISLSIVCATNLALAEPIITIKTSEGTIKIALDEQPSATTQNFIHYVQEGFYTGTIFHRVIPGFMIQGGGFLPDMTEKAADIPPLHHEGALCGKNTRGTIAMARTSDPHSATSQFFINTVDNPFLDFSAENTQDYGYCAFGHVIEGMSVVDKIAGTATQSVGPYQDVPVTPITIESMTSN